MKWAGANNPLWYFQDGKMMQIAPDKQPIGKSDMQKSFATHSVQMKKGDEFFLFTDGFADQFGGEKGKKFRYKPLLELLETLIDKPVFKQKEILLSTFNTWKGDLEQVDDVLVMGIKF